MIAAWLAGCVHPVVAYGPPVDLPLRPPPEDPDRYYVADDLGRTWFVDTGYTRTTCDDDLARALGLQVRGRRRVRGASGRTHVGRADLPALSLGGHAVSRVRCAVRDLATTSSVGDGVAGVLGTDVLGRFRLGLGPPSVHLEAPGPRLEGAVPFRWTRWHGRSPVLALDVEGHRIRGLADTGAARTCIDAARLPFDVGTVGHVQVRGTGTDAARIVGTFRADPLALAGHPLPGLEVVSLPRAWHVPDLIGLDVLGAFRSTWDFERREVVLEALAP